MNDAQKALLHRLREIVEETPKSGAVNAGGRPLHITRFAQAVEARVDDGDALVKYVRSKVHTAPTGSYGSLIAAGRPDLTVEAIVADAEAAWAGEFDDADRAAASERLGTMIEAHREAKAAAEAQAVTADRGIIDRVNASRAAKGKDAMTPEQEAEMLGRRAAERAGG